MADTPSANFVLGTPALLSTVFKVNGVPTVATGDVSLVVVDPLGNAVTYSGVDILNPSDGVYECSVPTTVMGLWHFRWVIDGQDADEGEFTVETDFSDVATDDTITAPDLTDLRVLVPRARRRCEGPFGPPPGKPQLSDEQLYEMVADGCSEVILFSGSLFGHTLIVAQRDPLVGYPTAWKTEALLLEWEGAVIACQTALTYFFFVLRDLKPTVSIKNEGTEYSYSLGVSAIRDYLATLKAERDTALAGLVKHHPVLDRYASNIRVRDQATVAVLEWWDTNSLDTGGGGMPGGQEAAVVPWTPGWSGPGFTMAA